MDGRRLFCQLILLLANSFGGALGYAIGGITSGLDPWRALWVFPSLRSYFDRADMMLNSFLIEGLPTILFAALAWFLLPDSIAQAKFLTEREKAVALHFTARNQRIDINRNQGLRFKEMFEGLTDPKSYIPGLMYFSCNVCYHQPQNGNDGCSISSLEASLQSSSSWYWSSCANVDQLNLCGIQM